MAHCRCLALCLVNAYGVRSSVRLFPAAYGSFLPVLNAVVIQDLCAGICCAVLRDSLYVCIILCNQCAIVKLD